MAESGAVPASRDRLLGVPPFASPLQGDLRRRRGAPRAGPPAGGPEEDPVLAAQRASVLSEQIEADRRAAALALAAEEKKRNSRYARTPLRPARSHALSPCRPLAHIVRLVDMEAARRDFIISTAKATGFIASELHPDDTPIVHALIAAHRAPPPPHAAWASASASASAAASFDHNAPRANAPRPAPYAGAIPIAGAIGIDSKAASIALSGAYFDLSLFAPPTVTVLRLLSAAASGGNASGVTYPPIESLT